MRYATVRTRFEMCLIRVFAHARTHAHAHARTAAAAAAAAAAAEMLHVYVHVMKCEMRLPPASRRRTEPRHRPIRQPADRPTLRLPSSRRLRPRAHASCSDGCSRPSSSDVFSVAAGLDAMLRSPQITAHEDRRAQVVSRSHEYEPRGQAQQQIRGSARKVKET